MVTMTTGFSTHLCNSIFFFFFFFFLKNKLKLDYFVARGLVHTDGRNFGADHFYASVQRDSDEEEEEEEDNDDDEGLFLSWSFQLFLSSSSSPEVYFGTSSGGL